MKPGWGGCRENLAITSFLIAAGAAAGSPLDRCPTRFALEGRAAPWHGFSMHTVTIEEAKQQLDELVAEAGRGGEIVITKGDLPVAKLAAAQNEPAAARGSRWAAFGLLKGKIKYGEGWDETPDVFRPYME